MISKFPIFKKLELSDKEEIEKITKKYPPYSDFNFTSIWSWDIEGKIRISVLNDNLVVRFIDYITDEHFYSFLGDNNTDDTVEKLLEFSKKEGMRPELRLLPEDSIKKLNIKKYSIIDHEDGFDYVYSTIKLANFSGSEHSNSRRLINRLVKTNSNIRVCELDLKNKEHSLEIIKLDNFWKKNKESNLNNTKQEKALLRLIEGAQHLSLYCLGIFIGDELISFTINEKLSDKYCISHFAKFNINHSGSYLHSMKVLNEELLKENYEHINCEQDLGLPGLRNSKKALCPAFYLKKYILREK